jgi:flagellar biosynthesis protein FliP
MATPRDISVPNNSIWDRCRILVVHVRDNNLIGVTRETISILDKLQMNTFIFISARSGTCSGDGAKDRSDKRRNPGADDHAGQMLLLLTLLTFLPAIIMSLSSFTRINVFHFCDRLGHAGSAVKSNLIGLALFRSSS